MAAFPVLACLVLLLSSPFVHAQTTSTSLSLSLSLTASSTGSALNCAATTANNVSACYPNLNEIPTCVVSRPRSPPLSLPQHQSGQHQQPCLLNVTLPITCSSTDFRCLCSKFSTLQEETLACLAINGTCSTANIQTAVNFYYNYCQRCDASPFLPL